MEYVERSLFIQWKHKHISERHKHVVLKMEAHMGGVVMTTIRIRIRTKVMIINSHHDRHHDQCWCWC